MLGKRVGGVRPATELVNIVWSHAVGLLAAVLLPELTASRGTGLRGLLFFGPRGGGRRLVKVSSDRELLWRARSALRSGTIALERAGGRSRCVPVEESRVRERMEVESKRGRLCEHRLGSMGLSAQIRRSN